MCDLSLFSSKGKKKNMLDFILVEFFAAFVCQDSVSVRRSRNQKLQVTGGAHCGKKHAKVGTRAR